MQIAYHILCKTIHVSSLLCRNSIMMKEASRSHSNPSLTMMKDVSHISIFLPVQIPLGSKSLIEIVLRANDPFWYSADSVGTSADTMSCRC